MLGRPTAPASAPAEAGQRPRTILFVCTGNTCRSPMAAAFAQAIVEDAGSRLGVTRVVSAGVATGNGYPATDEAVEALARMGVDLGGHRSRMLTPELLAEADVIFVMSDSHAEAVRRLNPEAAGKIVPLDPEGGIPDPYGGPLEIYEETAERLRELVAQRLKELSA